jgi:hypothetical protein
MTIVLKGAKQHALARQALPLIFAAEWQDQPLNYAALAQAMGYKPRAGRMIGAVCDLLDAAAALAGVPLIGLWRVTMTNGGHNPRAFADRPALREWIFTKARWHSFTNADRDAIAEALDTLVGKSNRVAWRYVEQQRPKFATGA